MSRHLESAFQPFWILKILIFLVVVGNEVYAQQSTSPPDNTNGPFTDAMERRSRETALRSLKRTQPERASDNSLSPELLRQINEDFKHIQIIRFGILDDIRDKKPFEYRRILDDTAEIKRRAGRLRDSLGLPDTKKLGKQSVKEIHFDKEQLQEALSNLCLEINRFIENPTFKSPGVYDIDKAIEASEVLEGLINLSNSIRKSVEKLSKSGN